MSVKDLTNQLEAAIRELSDTDSMGGMFHEHRDGAPLPSGPALQEIVELCRAILFPGFYGKSNLNSKTLPFHVGVNVEQLYQLLSEQIMAGLCFVQGKDEPVCPIEKGQRLAAEFIAKLPDLRRIFEIQIAQKRHQLQLFFLRQTPKNGLTLRIECQLMHRFISRSMLRICLRTACAASKHSFFARVFIFSSKYCRRG